MVAATKYINKTTQQFIKNTKKSFILTLKKKKNHSVNHSH